MGGDDVFTELLAGRASDADDPADGIALDEKFSYTILAVGRFLEVTVSKDAVEVASEIIDMSDSGYGVADDDMYFKAGVYTQNKSGDPDDYVQASFYELKASHWQAQHGAEATRFKSL